jgi:aspartyl-tRNA(Asn)/glutamyl-tRNA(Gln) amidotransferase subunit A
MALTPAPAVAQQDSNAPAAQSSAATPLWYTPATELAAAIREKRLSPVELVEVILARIESLNPLLNAYCTVVGDRAMYAAKRAEAAVMRGDRLGLLHGVPVSIKDLVFTEGIRTTGGSRIYRDYVPDEDEVVVERLKAAGAIILGKTNVPEFGYQGVTNNRLFGETLNPWNLDRTPGGSSGGAAAAVAAGLGPLAVGQDGGGSIRIPASFCGLFGLKPSFGRVPLYPSCRKSELPGFSGWESLEHTGPITRTVRDAALMLDVMAGHDDRDRHSLPGESMSYLEDLRESIAGMRVAWSPDLGYAPLDPVVRTVTTRAVRTFADLGCQVEEADPGFEDPSEAFATLMLLNTDMTRMRELANKWRDEMDPGLLGLLETSRSLGECADAGFVRKDLYNKMSTFFGRFDLLLTPTLAVPPFELGVSQPKEVAGRALAPGSPAWTPFTFPLNMTGQPAATVPCGWTEDGLPIGLQIVGPILGDRVVLRAAAAFEAAAPWVHRTPPIG